MDITFSMREISSTLYVPFTVMENNIEYDGTLLVMNNIVGRGVGEDLMGIFLYSDSLRKDMEGFKRMVVDGTAKKKSVKKIKERID